MKKRILIIGGVIITILIIGILLLKWPQEIWYTIRMAPYAFVLKTDIKRVHGLQALKADVVSYTQRTGTLPETISELNDDAIDHLNIFLDPVTKQKYEYRILSDAEQKTIVSNHRPAFEVCATFQGPSPIFRKDVTPVCKGICNAAIYFKQINPFEPRNTDFEFWDHGKGYTCWTFDSKGQWISGINTDIF